MAPSPQEPPFGDSGDGPKDGPSDDADLPLRGWIHPDDRLWRHPSEVAATAGGGAHPPDSLGVARPKRYRGQLMVVVTAGAMAAAGAFVFVLLSPASQRPAPATISDVADSPMTTLAGSVQTVPAVAEAAGHAMVELRAVTSTGIVLLTGVAVAEGGLVATTADALSDLRSLDMVGADGRLIPASVVGIDRDSDVALVTVPDDVPVAPFADDGTLSDGSPVMTLTLAGATNGAPTLRSQSGLVSGIGIPLSDGPAYGMPAIEASAPRIENEAGDPLLNASGAVVGLLYDDDASPGGVTTFYLPTQLILGVADDLRSSGRVATGWLGVNGTTVAGTPGATVMAVSAGSPATGMLRPGDVIVGVNSLPVRSGAELRARLYVLPPDASVDLTVLDGSTNRVVDVTLGSSP